jgi:hypothetical protein
MDILYNHAQMMDISLHIPLKLNLSEAFSSLWSNPTSI